MNEVFFHFGRYCGWMFSVRRHLSTSRVQKDGGFLCGFGTNIRIRLGILEITAFLWERAARVGDAYTPNAVFKEWMSSQ